MADLLRVLGLPAAPGVNATTPASASGQPPPGQGAVGGLSPQDLARAMAGMGAQTNRSIPLQDIVNVDDITSSGVLSDASVQQQLLSGLPEGHQTEQELVSTLHSPQFQQTLSSLSSALQSDSYGSILANFGLDASAGSEQMAQGNNVGAFLDAVQAQADRNANNASGDGGSGDMTDDKSDEKDEN